MPTLNVDSIKAVLDPASRYIFLDDAGMTQAFMIRDIKAKSILVAWSGLKIASQKRSGYFVASNGRGIIRFEAHIIPLNTQDSMKLDLYHLDLSGASFQLVNRREWNRFEFKVPRLVSFNTNDHIVSADIINLSEGGFRFSIQDKLPTHVIYQFHFELPTAEATLKFSTDGLIVYCEPEVHPQYFIAGVTFIAPPFQNEKELLSHQTWRRQLKNFLSTQSDLFL